MFVFVFLVRAERIELARARAKTVFVRYKCLYISLPSSAPYECTTETVRTKPFKKFVYIILLWNFTFCLDLFSKLYVCRYWNLPLLNMLRMRSVSNGNMGFIKCIGFYSEALKRRENSSNCAQLQTVFSKLRSSIYPPWTNYDPECRFLGLSAFRAGNLGTSLVLTFNTYIPSHSLHISVMYQRFIFVFSTVILWTWKYLYSDKQTRKYWH